MATNTNEKNSVKTSWIHIEISSPILGFIALPIVLLTFLSLHGFKEDYITCTLLSLVGITIIIFIVLVIFKPENLTIDGRGHLTIKKEEAKRKLGGTIIK